MLLNREQKSHTHTMHATVAHDLCMFSFAVLNEMTGVIFFPFKRSEVLCDLLLKHLLHQHFNELRSGGLIAPLTKVQHRHNF